MKETKIKKRFKPFGIKAKLKDADGKFYVRLRSSNPKQLERLIKKATSGKYTKTEKGILIPADLSVLEKVLGILEKQQANSLSNKERSTAEDLAKRYSLALEKKKYTERTQKNYRNHFKSFLANSKQGKNIELYNSNDISEYLHQRSKKKKYSISDVNMHLNALKVFYEDVCGRKNVIDSKLRPKKQGKLRRMYDDKSVKTFLSATGNLKHKAIVILACKVGASTKQISGLKLSDMNDFMTPQKISQSYQQILEKYLKTYKPKKFLFESIKPGKQITVRAIQKVLRTSKIS